MSSPQWKAEYQDELIVSKIIQLIKLNLYIISINHHNFKSKNFDSLFNYLIQIIKNNQLRNVKDNNIISNQKVKTLKSFPLSRISILYQKIGLHIIFIKNFTIFLF